MNKALQSVSPESIVSITQSTTSTSGVGYNDWFMTTMVVIQSAEDPSPAAISDKSAL